MLIANEGPRHVIARIKGGLGNQLFCYAAARRLALVNCAELVLDDVSGFARDEKYNRTYALNCFAIPCRKATSRERLEPCDRIRRGLAKLIARSQPFSSREYVEEEGLGFDARVLDLRFRRTLYLDGLWQSHHYFDDIQDVLKDDLRIQPPSDGATIAYAEKILGSQAIAVHVRWFDHYEPMNLGSEYYVKALRQIKGLVGDPQYFVFSTDSDRARAALKGLDERITYVKHDAGDESTCADLWLMAQCKHFIISNSTFSWWGAWLSQLPEKVVICPAALSARGIPLWSSPSVIPSNWIQIVS